MQDVLTKEQIKEQLWRRGNLKYKMTPVQLELYEVFKRADPRSILVWLCARQVGKSYLLAIVALETALQTKDTIVTLVTDTKIHIRTIYEKIFDALLEDCPLDIKPDYNVSQYTYHFKNGSQIQMAGTDGKNYQRLRGMKSALVLMDEAGFCSDLEDVVSSALLPTLTHTNGKFVMATTPPEDADHPFTKFQERAESQGLLTKKTIYDNTLLKPEQIQNIIEQMGGVENPRFRREYLVESIRETSRTIVPEFTPELEKEITIASPVPPFYDCYVSMDTGGKDLTSVLFAYYDFKRDKIVVQDEITMNFEEKDNHIATLSKMIMDKEAQLWTTAAGEVKKPFKRVSDIDYILIKEILKESGGNLSFQISRRDDLAASINNTRSLLASHKIEINPRCVTLLRHLRNVKWKSEKNHIEFARSPDNGHYDSFASLLILIRNMEFSRNPYPAGYDLNLRANDSFTGPNAGSKRYLSGSGSNNTDIFKAIFNVKRNPLYNKPKGT